MVGGMGSDGMDGSSSININPEEVPQITEEGDAVPDATNNAQIEQTLAASDLTLATDDPEAAIQTSASEGLSIPAAEAVEVAFVESVPDLPETSRGAETSESAPAEISLSPDGFQVEGVGEGGITIEVADAAADGGTEVAEADRRPKTEDRETIIDSNDGTSTVGTIDSNDSPASGVETVMIDTVPLPEKAAESAADGRPMTGDREVIIDSNDGTSSEAIGTWPTPERGGQEDPADGGSATAAEAGAGQEGTQPGEYKVQFEIQGDQPATGEISRMDVSETHVSVGFSEEADDTDQAAGVAAAGIAAAEADASAEKTTATVSSRGSGISVDDSGDTEVEASPGGLEVGTIEEVVREVPETGRPTPTDQAEPDDPGLEMPDSADTAEDLGLPGIEEPTPIEDVVSDPGESGEDSTDAADEIQEKLDELMERKSELQAMIAMLDNEISKLGSNDFLDSVGSTWDTTAPVSWLKLIDNSDGTFTFEADGGVANDSNEYNELVNRGIAEMQKAKNILQKAINEIDASIAALQQSSTTEE